MTDPELLLQCKESSLITDSKGINPCELRFNITEKKNELPTNKYSNKEKLQDIFLALEKLVTVLEKEKIIKDSIEINLIFRLINAEKKDRRIHKQLSQNINRLNSKELIKALTLLHEKSLEYPESINFDWLVEQTIFLQAKLKEKTSQSKRRINNCKSSSNNISIESVNKAAIEIVS